MNKIIVPVDFSEHSEYALEAAAILARKRGAEILVLHMLEISDAMFLTSSEEQKSKTFFFLRMAEQRFEQFLDKDYLKELVVTPVVKKSKVFSEISTVAKEQGAELIVMGSQGTSGFSEVFIGSNTEKVVRHSSIPVLVIKQRPTNFNFETVVFASDFTKNKVSVFKQVLQTIGPESDMNLLYVNVPGENFKSTAEIEQTVASFLMEADGNIERLNKVHYVSDYSIEKGIVNFANVLGADLIIMPTHGRKGFAHFFEGSITEDLANHSTLPVMTIKLKDE